MRTECTSKEVMAIKGRGGPGTKEQISDKRRPTTPPIAP